MGVVALKRNQIDAGFLNAWEDQLVLTPFGAKGFLPVGVGLDAIVNRAGFAGG